MIQNQEQSLMVLTVIHGGIKKTHRVLGVSAFGDSIIFCCCVFMF